MPTRRTDIVQRQGRGLIVAMLVSLGLADPAAARMIAVGEAFPAWQLSDQTGRQVASTELAGRTYLIWFYPKAMTPGCTAEGQALRDQFAAFQTKGVEILGVSFDEPTRNAEFCAAEALPFRLLSDRDKTLALAVGAADSKEQPVAKRISYLVGPDGKVLRAYDTVTPASHAGQSCRTSTQRQPTRTFNPQRFAEKDTRRPTRPSRPHCIEEALAHASRVLRAAS